MARSMRPIFRLTHTHLRAQRGVCFARASSWKGAALRGIYGEPIIGRKASLSSLSHALNAVVKERVTFGSTEAMDGMIMWRQFMARSRPRTFRPINPTRPIPCLSMQVDKTSVQRRGYEDMVANFEAEADAMTTDTAGTMPDAATDAASGTQTPASSVDSDIIQRIDPHLLSDDSRQGRKRLKGN